MSAVRIVQLYPAQLGITGDRGNVRTLRLRLEAHGIPVEVSHVAPGEELPEDCDILVIGNGPLSALRGVHADLHARRDALAAHLDAGGALLSIGGSAELLGAGIDLLDGEHVPGLGLLPYRVARTRDRRVGYIVVETPLGRVLGFEDHASEWTLEDPDSAYGAVAWGHGSFDAATGRGEIVRVGNALAANVQGPLLPLNPAVSDALLVAAAERRGLAFAPKALGALDEYADEARATIDRLLHGRDFNTIGV